MPFQPGHSGNPAGRPRGARNKTSVLVEQLLEGDAEAIMRRMIDQAKAGNSRALSLLVPALLPKRKDAFIELDLPPLEQASDAPGAIAAIIRAVCTSEVTPQEGTSLTRMVEAYGRAQQKLEKLGRKPELEKAAVAIKMRDPAEPHVQRERQAPSPPPAIVQADTPAAADELNLDSVVAEALRPFFEERDRKSTRLNSSH